MQIAIYFKGSEGQPNKGAPGDRHVLSYVSQDPTLIVYEPGRPVGESLFSSEVVSRT